MVAMYIYAAVVVIFAPLLMLVVRAILDCVRRQTSTGMQVPLLAYVLLPLLFPSHFGVACTALCARRRRFSIGC